MNDSSGPFELSVTARRDNDSAIELLGEQCELSRTQLKQAMACGALWLRRGRKLRRVRRSSHSLREGDELTLCYSADILNESVLPPVLLSDERDYSVWIKPRGVLSQGTRYGDHCAMVRLVEKALLGNADAGQTGPEPRTVMLVHRLDRYASGLMVLAHNKRTAAALSAMFRNRTVRKHYTALVYGCVTAEQNGRVIDSDIDGKSAHTKIVRAFYNSANDCANCSLLEVQISTGRKHQVRRHLAEIGHAIVGDRQYGPSDSTSDISDISGTSSTLCIAELSDMDLQLSASLLEFSCPISQQKKCYTLPDSYLTEMQPALSHVTS